MMYVSSEDQVFARVSRLRARASRLLGEGAAPPPSQDDDTVLEAQAMAAHVELRLPSLCATFELDALASDVLVCLVATEYDPFMRTVVRAVQRELGRPWIEIGTVAELLDLAPAQVPRLAALFAPHGPLRRYSLALLDDSVEAPVVATRVKLAARIAQHLVGDDTLPDGMKRIAPRPTLPSSLVPEEETRALVGRTRRALGRGERLVVELSGAPGTGRRFLAEGLAHDLGRSLLVVDLAAVDRHPESRLAERLAEARREARLTGALVCLANWDAHWPSTSLGGGSDEATAALPSAPRRIPPVFARFFEETAEVVVLTAEEREPLLERHAESVAHVAVPFPTPSQRAALLASALGHVGAEAAEDAFLPALARRYALDPARIEVAARTALELARDRRPTEHAATDALATWGVPPAAAGLVAAGGAPLLLSVSRAELNEACRRQLRHDLKSLAVRVTASHKWEDLVIPVDVYDGLREMLAYVEHAAQVYEKWGFGVRHSLAQGVSALFAGPPGTGKTMCASVMAHALDMELFRVDLSRVVSKWIGETEKNLGKVFDEAERSHAIILFDEADSLFAKRTEVKSSVDRYANLEVNFLLQRMEAFSGMTILTTNFEDTIDTAFKRRLTFRLRFEKPDADARAALWHKVFPDECAVAADVDRERLGAIFEMSGGNIRNAAVRAAFLAAAEGKPIDMETCMIASERESREMGLLTRSASSLAAADLAESEASEAFEARPVGGGPRLRPLGHLGPKGPLGGPRKS